MEFRVYGLGSGFSLGLKLTGFEFSRLGFRASGLHVQKYVGCSNHSSAALC